MCGNEVSGVSGVLSAHRMCIDRSATPNRVAAPMASAGISADTFDRAAPYTTRDEFGPGSHQAVS